MTTATGPQIDADDALALLTEAVTAKGADWVEPWTIYAFPDAPCCLVGHALHGGGVSLADLKRLNIGADGDVVAASTIDGILPGVTPAACAIFQAAQEVQDDRRPWGHALRAALDTHAQLAAQDDADAQRHATEA